MPFGNEIFVYIYISNSTANKKLFSYISCNDNSIQLVIGKFSVFQLMEMIEALFGT